MKNEPAFAIIRIDDDLTGDARFTITRIVWDEAFAESEVRRLNNLNAKRGARYVLQVTRAQRRGRAT